MSQFNKKYKDRTPEETVSLIKHFFEQRKIEVELIENAISEAGTHYCHIELTFNGRKILHANGKGMNEAFALASGYAEAYERFCNTFPILCNISFGRKYRELSLAKNGYAYKSGEKLLTIDNLQENDKTMQTYFQHSYKNRYDIIELFIKTQTDGKIIGSPFKNIADETDISYFDHRIYNRIMGSKGFAAGNTITEAINQGLSELFESYCIDSFVTELQDSYYEIDIEKIENEELKKAHRKMIEAGNYEVHYLDLSYNFKYPVMAGIVIDKVRNRMFMDLGSFPIFDIALERVITELYQGIKSFKTVRRFNKPFRGAVIFTPNSPLDYFIDERIYERIKMVDTYNKEYYLQNTETGNEEILQFGIQLLNRDGIRVYYEDNSLIDEVKAVALYSPDLVIAKLKLKNIANLSEQEVTSGVITTLRLYQAISLIVEAETKEDIPEKAITSLLEASLSNTSLGAGQAAGNMMFGEWLELYGLSELYVLGVLRFYNQLEYACDYIDGNTLYSGYIRRFAMIQSFAANPEYTNEESIKYLHLYGIETTPEEMKMVFNKEYLVRKMIAEPYYEYYHSKEYEELVSTYIH